ncbi:MAG: DNA polymerase II [Nanoarchaeota archaeon]
MKGYIVSASNTTDESSTQVQLFGKLENNESFVILQKLEPYFFIKESDAKKNKPYLSKFITSETSDKNFHGEKVIKISHSSQQELNKLQNFLAEKDIETYEADIKPQQRLLIDKNILGSLEISGEYEKGDRVNRIYNNPKISPSNFTPELKVISIDIESDKKLDNLFCIGLYGKKEKITLMITNKKIPNVIACKSERECLEKFKEKILELDPDIITGWNVIDFDFQFLKRKFEEHQLEFDIGRDNKELRLRIESNFFRSSTVIISGRQVLDGLNLIKDPFIQEAPSIRNAKFDSWALEDVSQSILGKGKLIKGKQRHDEITSLYEKDQAKLAEYNLIDCQLAYEILEKSKTLELAIERSQLTGITLDKLTASIIAFDSLYIREARARGLVSPTTHFKHKEERIKGGYVMESNPGIYSNVIVLDFKSLYPSIIKTFNIDPASFTNEKTNTIESPNGAHFKNQDGILPEIINKLHQAREKAKKEKRELASYAIKIIMNSFFGVLASPNCRYFSLDIANAITHFGQFIIKLTAEQVRKENLQVIYSDTDSVFIATDENKKNAELLTKGLPEKINKFYDKYIEKNYKRHSFLELEFKKHYLSFIIPRTRDLEKGSKKRYAGLVENNGKEEIEITGLEAIRGDWTEAARDFQKELLDKVFHKEEVKTFIKSYVKKILNGDLDKKLIYSKSIRKDLKEYTKTTPPHVKAARQLEKLDSTLIQYYITTKGPEPIQKLKSPLDYKHYIDKQIAPIANTILAFFNTNFEDLIKDSKQKKLFP